MKPDIELSIVIPTLNEELTIPGTLDRLAAQKGVRLEVIVSDGGSVDRTCAAALKSRLAVTTVTGARGRAAQLNAGAVRAQGEFILFLHADCFFSDEQALVKGLEALRAGSCEGNGKAFAGHFRLKFNRSSNTPALDYRFIEAKARIDREGCAHGDQGILISRSHFRLTGGFDESSLILAETRFADRLRHSGEWLLLPADIHTSARRFEHEGVKERQALNAVIMALGAAGREDFLARIPDLYRDGGQGSRVGIGGVYARVMALTAELSEPEQSLLWERVGSYLCSNAWQIALFLDELNRFYGRGKSGDNRILAQYERYLEKACNSRLAAKVAAAACRACSRAFFRPSQRQKN